MSEKFPVFRNPEKYMRMRHKATLSGRLKVRFENRALDRCLEGLDDVRVICDVPTGPGRLFPYWKSRDLEVIGLDYSPEMVQAATDFHRDLGMRGSVGHGNAFEPPTMDPAPDLIASVRFIYYFDAEKRVELLKALAGATRRYVLVQYKTTETLKGFINKTQDVERGREERPSHLAKVGCPSHQILRELTAAGLTPLRIEPIGEFSDRAYVLAEKATSLQESPDPPREVRIPNTPRFSLVATVFSVIAFLMLVTTGAHSLWSEVEAFHALGGRSVLEGNILMPLIFQDFPASVPPLVFWWLGGVGWLLGGVSDITVNLASLIAAMLVLGLSYAGARKFLTKEAAILSTVILATSYEFWEMSHEANREMLLTALLIPAFWSLARFTLRSTPRPSWWVPWFLIGLGGLSNGISGLALGIIVAFFILLLGRKGRPISDDLKEAKFAAGLILCLAPLAIWACLAGVFHGWKPVVQILLEDPTSRFGDVLGDRRGILWYFLQLPVNFLPWSFLIPAIGIWRARRNRRMVQGDDWTRICWIILICGFIVVTLQPQKEDYFLLPLMPWIAYLLGREIWIQIMPGVSIDSQEAPRGRSFWGALLGLRQGRVYVCATILILAAMGTYAVVFMRLEDSKESMAPIAERLEAADQGDDHLLLYEDEELRVMFYLDEPFRLIQKEDLQALSDSLAQGTPYDILVSEKDLVDFNAISGAPLYVRDTFQLNGRVHFVLSSSRTNKTRDAGPTLVEALNTVNKAN